MNTSTGKAGLQLGEEPQCLLASPRMPTPQIFTLGVNPGQPITLLQLVNNGRNAEGAHQHVPKSPYNAGLQHGPTHILIPTNASVSNFTHRTAINIKHKNI